MANRNKLSIYLIKQEYANPEDYIIDGAKVLTEIPDVGTAYYLPSKISTPKWVKSFFNNTITTTDIFSSNSRITLICTIPIVENESTIYRTFAVTMGYGKYLLVDDAIEDGFGLRVVLNTIQPDSLRRINKVSVGGNLKSSNEQLPLQSEINDFGFDVDRDLISTITGYSSDTSYVSGIISGGDVFSITTEVDISNINDFLKATYLRYKETTYRKNFGWVDHIKKVKNSTLIENLNNRLIELINNDSKDIWMAVPEVIEWENISGFKYSGKDLYDDIDINIVKNSFNTELKDISQLKSKHIYAIQSIDGISVYRNWSAYKCICGEVEYSDRSYCINNGSWFQIDKDFVSAVNNDYLSTSISQMPFIDYLSSYKSENDYSIAFTESNNQYLICMDKQNIMHGGGQSRIELCDILTTDGTFIHIKPYSGSATLSHLFNQAVVSAELVLSDIDFVTKANQIIDELSDNKNFHLKIGNKPNIILGIITKHDCDLPPIPFFSKVALRYCKKRLEIAGCSVSMKNIKIKS